MALSELSLEDEEPGLPLAGGGASAAKVRTGRVAPSNASVINITLVVRINLFTTLTDVIDVNGREDSNYGIRQSGYNDAD